MKLENIVDESAYCSIGCITKPDDIHILEQYLMFNYDVICRFHKIIVAHNRLDEISNENFEKYNQVWNKIFGDKCIILNRPNYGHTFGFIDLDRTVLSKAKKLGYKWVWKSTNDVIIKVQIFSINFDNENFLYLQGHGISGMGWYNNDVILATNSFKNNGYEHFFPQTNFYITTTTTNELISKQHFDYQYTNYLLDPEYKKMNKHTAYKYASCEDNLRLFVLRNKLICKHLIGKQSYRRLLKAILVFKIEDSSHKNIFFKECGICHLHFPNEPILEI